MPVSISCPCGRSYELKDEFAGTAVTCPACGSVIDVPAPPPPPPARNRGDTALDRNKFIIRQRLLAVNEVYDICGEDDVPVLYAERQRFTGRGTAAFVYGVLTAGLNAWFFIRVGSILKDPQWSAVAYAWAALGGAAILFAAYLLSHKRRDIYFYRDSSAKEPVFTLRQEHLFQFFEQRFTLLLPSGEKAGSLRREVLESAVRSRWRVEDASGAGVLDAVADSLTLSLMRTFLLSGGTARWAGRNFVNFHLCRGDGGGPIGELKRMATVFDYYDLDLSGDPLRTADRRLVLALAVLLDSGEKR